MDGVGVLWNPRTISGKAEREQVDLRRMSEVLLLLHQLLQGWSRERAKWKCRAPLRTSGAECPRQVCFELGEFYTRRNMKMSVLRSRLMRFNTLERCKSFLKRN